MERENVKIFSASEMCWYQTSIVVLLLVLAQDCEGLLKRCFSCRSRGDLGDCRDPFLLSSGLQVSTIVLFICVSQWFSMFYIPFASFTMLTKGKFQSFLS
jgi:hypothetical protein